MEDTFAWIWDSPFTTWLDSLDKIFWIRGKPASGKSTLLSYIAQDPRVEEQIAAHYGSRKVITLAFYFDFRQGTTTANSFQGMLLTVIYSLIKQVSGLAARLRAASSKWQGIYEHGKWDTAALIQAANYSFQESKLPVCFFLDGLDEFHGNHREMLDLAMYLEKLPSFGNVKLCFSSRPHEILERKFGTAMRIDIQDWNLPGLRNYFLKTFHDIGLAANELQLVQITHLSDFMAEMAEGVFLWAKFAVNNVIELWAKKSLSFEMLLLELGRLARDVETLWDERRGKLDEAERSAGTALLRIACSSARLLGAMELVKVFRNQVTQEDVRQLLDASHGLKQQISHLSCGLLEIREDTLRRPTKRTKIQTVTLVHKSVRRYLHSRGWWLANEDFRSPEEMWLEECCELIKKSTYATERSLCFQNRPHDRTNPVCKKYSCYSTYPDKNFPTGLYEELHGKVQRTIMDESGPTKLPLGFFSRWTLTFVKEDLILHPLMSYAFHWLAYHGWLLQCRRQKSCLDITNGLMCPELVILMSRLAHHSCALCDSPVSENYLTFHGSEQLLAAFSQQPSTDSSWLFNVDAASDTRHRATLRDYTDQTASSLFVCNEVANPNDSSPAMGGNSASITAPNLACVMQVTRLAPPPAIPKSSNGRTEFTSGAPKQRKIAVVGSRAVSKSSLVVQFVDGHFVESYYPTIENTFSKIIRYKGQDYATEIVDTAGQDEYSILNSKHFIGIHGYVLVYSVGSKQSFEMIAVIRDKILNHLGAESVPMVIVGNNSDLRPEQRQVTVEEGQQLAAVIKCPVIEASSRYNENVSRVFEQVIAEIEKGQAGETEDRSCCVM